MNPAFSAIANAPHSAFIREQDTKVALISGITASKCVKDTKEDCESRGITPIMIMDSTDLSVMYDQATARNYDEFRGIAEMTWGKDCLTTYVTEVQQWVAEL